MNLLVSLLEVMAFRFIGRVVAKTFLAAEVPPLQPLEFTFLLGCSPQPSIELQLMLQGDRKRTRRRTRFDIDQRGCAVPSKHQIEFTSRPTFGMEQPLGLVHPGVLEPWTSKFPTLAPANGGARR